MTTLTLNHHAPAPSIHSGAAAFAAALLTAALLVALSWGQPTSDAPQWHGNAGHVSLAR